MDFKQELTKILEKHIKEPFTLTQPPNPELGDLSLACFKLTKKPEVLKKEVKLPDFIEKAEIKGPYLNFFLNKSKISKQIVEEVLKKKKEYGSTSSGKGKKVLIEHTSINPNASPHVGRARNALIGDAIVRLLKFEKYKVEVHYFVNDIGKQIALLVLACKGKTPTFDKILQIYIDFNKEVEQNPELEKQVFDVLNKLEKGDQKVRAQFRKIVDLCIKGQTKILGELGIKYDSFDYESDYIYNKKAIPEVMKRLDQTKKVFVDEEKRLTLNLEGFNLPMEHPYLPLTRGDGTSLYMLRDLAYAMDKAKWAKDRNLLVLGEDQKLYFLQLKTLLSLMNVEAPEVVHYSFILLKSGKMSTRKGEVVLLEDFMKEAEEKAEEEIKKRHNKADKKLAKMIAYSAVKLGILKVSAEKNIIFDLETALSFEGESGPYIQYAYARANSILTKAKGVKAKPAYEKLTSKSEAKLIKHIAEFEQAVKQAVKHLHPHIIAAYSLQLAQAFNEFYHECPVLTEEKELTAGRLNLVKASMYVLENSLNLLGIEAPKKM